jgi:hypothetical protein
MLSRMIMAAMVVQGSCRVGIAQDDVKSPIDRRQHEACRNQGAQAEHCEHERCSPVAGSTVLQLFRSTPHGSGTMPEALHRIKWGFSVRGRMVIGPGVTHDCHAHIRADTHGDQVLRHLLAETHARVSAQSGSAAADRAAPRGHGSCDSAPIAAQMI